MTLCLGREAGRETNIGGFDLKKEITENKAKASITHTRYEEREGLATRSCLSGKNLQCLFYCRCMHTFTYIYVLIFYFSIAIMVQLSNVLQLHKSNNTC